jgi:hypothetical protein
LPNLPCIPEEQWGVQLTDIVPANELDLNEPVAKLGRSTGYTQGRVSAVNMEHLDVICQNPRRSSYVFAQVIEIAWDNGTRFGAAGDSGALVYRLKDKRPIGLYFASFEHEGSFPASYAIQLDRVRAEYNLTLV